MFDPTYDDPRSLKPQKPDLAKLAEVPAKLTDEVGALGEVADTTDMALKRADGLLPLGGKPVA